MKRIVLLATMAAPLLCGQANEPRTLFRVKYVAAGAVYLDGGRDAGLTEGMKLTVTRPAPQPEGGPPLDIAGLEVTAVAATSAACVLREPREDVVPGDQAHLSTEDVETIRASKTSAGARQFTQVVSFTEGDPVEEEARASVPRPPSPEVNRARGRVGFEYGAIRDHGENLDSSQVGLVFRGDLTRIGGSYWNLSGYWRGRVNRRGSSQQLETLSDLMNRTYHLTLYYNNPQSRWVAGFGRQYLPWAASLETIDGGYFGRRLGKDFTAGMFGGSTPDPTSWNYKPNRQLLGSFVNYTSGSFESIRFTSTAGAAVSRINWRPERQFAFFENSLFYKRYLSVYHNLEADQVSDRRQPGSGGVQLSRSFLTVRLQPLKILSVDLSHNYFRNLATFDPRLVGTGLLDKLLFQGASAGIRLDLPLASTVYASLGRSDRTGDTRRALNQMYGVTKHDIFGTGIRADVRYTEFDGSFGRGNYRAVSVGRDVGNVLRFELQAGDQHYASALTATTRARFVSANGDWFFTPRYFLGGGYTFYRSSLQNYDQLYLNLGYRF
jgi:hypothetical protein